MKKKRFSIGPGAASLILMVVVVSMSVLGMLSLIGARNDGNLTKRNTQVITSIYDLNGKSERTLMMLDAERQLAAQEASGDAELMEDLSERLEEKYPGVFDVDCEEGIIYWTEYADYSATDIVNTMLFRLTGAEIGGRKCLNCGVKIALQPDEGQPSVQWILHTTGNEAAGE
ncbi:MAG: hypothetical protein CW338_01255 [Clostridiales bacterium]|nr:hypothetical protein [Clostridiales bacterium]